MTFANFKCLARLLAELGVLLALYLLGGQLVAWFGWPIDPQMEKLRDSYAKETDPAKAKELAHAVQNRALETAQYGWIGQWYGPGVARKNVTGWLKAPVPVMWNIAKA